MNWDQNSSAFSRITLELNTDVVSLVLCLEILVKEIQRDVPGVQSPRSSSRWCCPRARQTPSTLFLRLSRQLSFLTLKHIDLFITVVAVVDGIGVDDDTCDVVGSSQWP